MEDTRLKVGRLSTNYEKAASSSSATYYRRKVFMRRTRIYHLALHPLPSPVIRPQFSTLSLAVSHRVPPAGNTH